MGHPTAIRWVNETRYSTRSQQTETLERGKKVSDIQPNRPRQALHIVDGDIAFAALDGADVSSVKSRAAGQFFLR